MSFAGLFAVILGCALLAPGRHRPADAAPPPPAGRHSRRARPDGGRRGRRLALAHGGRHRRPGDRGLGDGRHRGDDRQLPADGGALAGDDAAVGRLRHGAQPGAEGSAAPTSIRRWRGGRWRCRGSPGGIPSAASSSPPLRAGPAGGDRGDRRAKLARTFELKEGQPAEAWPAFQTGDAVLVSEPFASRTGLGTGATIRLRTERGDRDFRVVGVYYDYASDQGVVLMSRATYLRHWNDRSSPASRSTSRPGPMPTGVAERLRAAIGGERALLGPVEPGAQEDLARDLRPHLPDHLRPPPAGGPGRLHRRPRPR